MLRGLIVGKRRHHRRAHLYIMNDTSKFIKRLFVMMLMTKTTHCDVVVVVIVVEAVRVNRVELFMLRSEHVCESVLSQRRVS